MYVNGKAWGYDITAADYGEVGTLNFTGIPVGAKVWFHIDVAVNDTLTFKFYD